MKKVPCVQIMGEAVELDKLVFENDQWFGQIEILNDELEPLEYSDIIWVEA